MEEQTREKLMSRTTEMIEFYADFCSPILADWVESEDWSETPLNFRLRAVFPWFPEQPELMDWVEAYDRLNPILVIDGEEYYGLCRLDNANFYYDPQGYDHMWLLNVNTGEYVYPSPAFAVEWGIGFPDDSDMPF